MKDTAYAFCVARIRALETSLLDKDFLLKLCDCPDYDSCVSMLKANGWIDGGDSLSEYISSQNQKLWNVLVESVPDKNEMKTLCVLNDYFNIKCIVKCVFTGEDANKYFLSPTSLNVDELRGLIKDNKSNIFTDGDMINAYREAYDIAVKTENGQNAEILIDNATLKVLLKYAAKRKNSVFSEICSFVVDSSNIRTAFRCIDTNKNADFIDEAISDCSNFDRGVFLGCVSKGKDSVLDYISNTAYSEGAEKYLESPALYDKWCDDKVIEIAKKSRYTAFGFDPVCAYYYAKTTEIKTVRIILSSKQSGISADKIKERVRETYV